MILIRMNLSVGLELGISRQKSPHPGKEIASTKKYSHWGGKSAGVLKHEYQSALRNCQWIFLGGQALRSAFTGGLRS